MNYELIKTDISAERTIVIVSDTSVTVNIAGTDYKLLARA